MKSHKVYAKIFGLTIVPVDDLIVERHRRSSDAWDYVSAQGALSRDRQSDIDALVIPPAWEEVRISADAKAHLQAIGRDAKGRLQYLYHPDWHRVREAVKADRLVRFGNALPKIRDQVEKHLQLPFNRTRSVLATLVRLIDQHSIRIGNEQYAKQGTRGATTLRTEHVSVKGNDVEISYTGKSGQEIELSISDAKLKKRLKALKRHNRGRLFKAARAGKTKNPIRASRLNAYLTKCAGSPVSAKDFRTFRASSLALTHLCSVGHCEREGEKRAAVAKAAKLVSQDLRNTPAVARSSYIHPSIITAFEKDALHESLIKGRKRKGLSRKETALMRFFEAQLKP